MRVAIIDDHPIVRDAIVLLMQSLPEKHDITGFGTLDEFERGRSSDGYNIVLLDLGLPGHRGISALERFKADHEETPVVVLSATCDRETILAALDCGAMGFIPKTAGRDVLLGAIKLVASGGIYVPPEAIRPASGRAATSNAGASGPSTSEPKGSAHAAVGELTARQIDVLHLLLQGMSNKVICRQLDISPNTVKSHLAAIFRVLDVSNRTQAVIAAQQLGIRIDYAKKGA